MPAQWHDRPVPTSRTGDMLFQTYRHRLPADYDMGIIRHRAATRGALWDDTPGLGFKAFAARERGRFGATDQLYASFYLWLDTRAAVDFLTDRFSAVVDSFGRPAIESRVVLDAQTGPPGAVVSLYREDADVPDRGDLATFRQNEIALNRSLIKEERVLAVVTAIDVATWRMTRITLSAAAPDPAHAGLAYEVLHLAKPGWADVQLSL